MNISKGIIPTAKKVVIYGPEGIGKSTFAAKFPGAVFLDTEGSTAHMDVARFDTPGTWGDILATVDWAIGHHGQIGTFVIDTMDWAEAMAFRAVCQEKKVAGIEDIPYGKGYVFAKDKIRELLEKLDRLKEKGVNIVLTAHAIVRKFEQPDELGSYDRYALKLNEKNIAPLVKEWADLLLFANYRTDVITTQDGKKKATGGRKRVMYTSHAATWDAKNRFGLAEELPFEFTAIAELFTEAPGGPQEAAPAKAEEEPVRAPEAPQGEAQPKRRAAAKKSEKVMPNKPQTFTSEDPAKDRLLAKLWDLMSAAGVPDSLLLQTIVADKGYYPVETVPADYDADFIADVLIEAWPSVRDLMQTVANNLPF